MNRRSDGTLQGLREQLPWPEGRPFRILAIDGGGIKGILPATILAELERRFAGGRSVGSYFDLIAGTSTGGIIALGLSVGISAAEIASVYLEHGEAIFPPLRWDVFTIRRKLRFLRSIRHYVYDSAPLKAVLDSKFGERTIGDAARRLCVPTFDGYTEVNVFKTPHHPDYKLDWKVPLLTAAMATASAPTYFPVYKDGGQYFGDGGVWANNPVMIGLVDALVCNDIDRRQVHILSLGCGDTEMIFTKKQIVRGGLWHWKEIVSSAMHLQSQNAIGQAGLLIGRDQLIRLNAPKDPSNLIELDDYKRASTELPSIARKLVEADAKIIGERFFFDTAEPYRAYHGPRAA